MRNLKIFVLPFLAFTFLTSCVSVRVATDYDREANFTAYKTYAFYKTGIDRAQISDLDKKRILSAIETEMGRMGYTKSQDPDLLVNIFTKEREQVDVYNNNFGWGWGGFGWGWGGFGWGGWGWPGWGWGGAWGPNVSTRTEGSLYIDLIDNRNKGLVWQGRGVGNLNNTQNIDKKEERIREFVSEIMSAYPPNQVVASN